MKPNFLYRGWDRHRCLAACLVFLIGTSHLGYAAPWVEFCQNDAIFRAFRSADALLSRQPVIDGYPWEIKMRSAVLTHESRQQGKYIDPMLILGGLDEGRVLFPVYKIEPFVDRIFFFGHARLGQEGFGFYPKGEVGQSIETIYPHGLPNPALMDFYRTETLTNLFHSYKKQELPAKAWHQILGDEFALANHRSFEVVITQRHEVRAYVRIYISSKELGAERQAFGDDVPTTKLFSSGLPGGSSPAYLSPAERLLKRFGIEENPVEDLRKQFPSFMIAEVGRLNINHDFPPAERQQAKTLLLNSMVAVLQEIAPERDLARLIAIASSGPFGERTYPREFGMSQIYKTQLKPENLVQDIPEGSAEVDGIALQFFWVPDVKAVASSQQEDMPRDLTLFAVPGDVLQRKLQVDGVLLEGFPVVDEFPYLRYNSMVDQKID